MALAIGSHKTQAARQLNDAVRRASGLPGGHGENGVLVGTCALPAVALAGRLSRAGVACGADVSPALAPGAPQGGFV